MRFPRRSIAKRAMARWDRVEERMGNRALRTLAALCSLPLALAAQTVVNGGRQITGAWDAGGAVSTRPAKTGTSLPAACATGEQFFKTDAAAGQNLFLCTGTNTWTQISGGSGGGAGLPGMGGNQGKVLSNDGATATWQALAGDVSGTPGTLSVNRIKGQPVSSAAPVNSDGLVYDGSAYQPRPLRYAFQDVMHFVDYFPTCGIAGDGAIGTLGWFKGGSAYFAAMTCGTETTDFPPIGITPTTTNNSDQPHYMALNALRTNYGSGSKRWTFEWTFTPDASATDALAWLALANGTAMTAVVGLRHDPATESGFTLCVVSNASKCFAGTPGTGLLAWDTTRHTVRFEKVSATEMRGRIDGGPWFNFHSTAGSDGPNDLYGVVFPTASMVPMFYLKNTTTSGQRKMVLHRFEMLYGY
jgi:hypothetical protein